MERKINLASGERIITEPVHHKMRAGDSVRTRLIVLSKRGTCKVDITLSRQETLAMAAVMIDQAMNLNVMAGDAHV